MSVSRIYKHTSVYREVVEESVLTHSPSTDVRNIRNIQCRENRRECKSSQFGKVILSSYEIPSFTSRKVSRGLNVFFTGTERLNVHHEKSHMKRCQITEKSLPLWGEKKLEIEVIEKSLAVFRDEMVLICVALFSAMTVKESVITKIHWNQKTAPWGSLFQKMLY